MELVCDKASITLNKNAVFGDRSALSPGGVRIGTPALTTRGFKESDFEKVRIFNTCFENRTEMSRRSF